MISSLNKEGCKISRTLKVSGKQNERALAFTGLEIPPNAMPNQSCNGGVIEFSLPLPWVLSNSIATCLLFQLQFVHARCDKFLFLF